MDNSRISPPKFNSRLISTQAFLFDPVVFKAFIEIYLIFLGKRRLNKFHLKNPKLNLKIFLVLSVFNNFIYIIREFTLALFIIFSLFLHFSETKKNLFKGINTHNIYNQVHVSKLIIVNYRNNTIFYSN